MSSQPILSICIPTYNRSDYLRKCIDAIVSQKEFDERVEIIISDNCSSDDTEEFCNSICSIYKNIRYFRNGENVADENFTLALQRATGLLRKLTNDTVVFKPNALSYMIRAAEENLSEKPLLYFLSSGKQPNGRHDVFSIDEFVDAVGVNMTWIRSLALWEEDCKDLRVLKDNAHTQMAQIPLLLYQVESKGHAVIYDEPIMDSLPVEKKNLTYGLHQVFYNNFLGHLRTYLNKGYLSKSCYERLRKKLLLEFFCNWIIIKENNDGQYIFSDENLQRLIESEYKRDNYYLVFKAKLFKMRVASFVNKYVRPKRNQKN